MTDWRIATLDKAHDRTAFDCGRPELDEFLRKQVSQYEKRMLGKTYVAVLTGSSKVVGFYTIATGSVSYLDLPADTSRKLPRHRVPAVLVARLAVDRSMQGRQLGSHLLFDAIARAVAISEIAGVHGIEVDAIDDSAAAFYRKYGFETLTDNAHHLFLPLARARTMLP